MKRILKHEHVGTPAAEWVEMKANDIRWSWEINLYNWLTEDAPEEPPGNGFLRDGFNYASHDVRIYKLEQRIAELEKGDS